MSAEVIVGLVIVAAAVYLIVKNRDNGSNSGNGTGGSGGKNGGSNQNLK
jgi:hypothetical protein